MKLKISDSPTQNQLEEIDLSLTTRRGIEYLIGRSPDSDLVLDSEDVSRHHGKFFYQSGNYYFSDLGSRNGTILNGKLAQKNHSYILKNGDLLRIGDFALMMEEDISLSEQSETVVRIIKPEIFSNRSSQNASVGDVATPSSEFVSQSQESQPVVSQSIAEEFVNTSEELTLVQSDEALSANADIIIPNNTAELHQDNVSDAVTNDVDSHTPVEEATANTIQSRDILQDEEVISQEDNFDSDVEEIAAQTQKENAKEVISQEDNFDSDAQEIAVQNQEDEKEVISQEDNFDSDAEEIAVQTQEEDEKEAQSEIIEVTTSDDVNLETQTEVGEELVSEIASIRTSDVSEELEVVTQETQEDAVENISEESFELASILEDKQIILISHETKKSELAELVAEHEEFLSYCLTRTWQTFSNYLHSETGLSVTQEIPPATSGGYQAINSLINSKEIIAVIFLRDFIAPQRNQASEEALLRTCNINEILLATNLPTAQAVINYLKNMKDSEAE